MVMVGSESRRRLDALQERQDEGLGSSDDDRGAPGGTGGSSSGAALGSRDGPASAPLPLVHSLLVAPPPPAAPAAAAAAAPASPQDAGGAPNGAASNAATASADAGAAAAEQISAEHVELCFSRVAGLVSDVRGEAVDMAADARAARAFKDEAAAAVAAVEAAAECISAALGRAPRRAREAALLLHAGTEARVAAARARGLVTQYGRQCWGETLYTAYSLGPEVTAKFAAAADQLRAIEDYVNQYVPGDAAAAGAGGAGGITGAGAGAAGRGAALREPSISRARRQPSAAAPPPASLSALPSLAPAVAAAASLAAGLESSMSLGAGSGAGSASTSGGDAARRTLRHSSQHKVGRACPVLSRVMRRAARRRLHVPGLRAGPMQAH